MFLNTSEYSLASLHYMEHLVNSSCRRLVIPGIIKLISTVSSILTGDEHFLHHIVKIIGIVVKLPE